MIPKEEYKRAWEHRVSEYTAHCKYDPKWLNQDKLYTCYIRGCEKVNLNNKSILDFGCGGAFFGEYAFSVAFVKKYIGLDIAERSINTAKETLINIDEKKIQLELISPDELDFSKYKVNIFTCFSVIQHFPDLQYFNYFFSVLNNSNIQTLLLQTKYGSRLTFRDEPYKTTHDIGNACMCRPKDLIKRLTNYELKRVNGIEELSEYQYYHFRRKKNGRKLSD